MTQIKVDAEIKQYLIDKIHSEKNPGRLTKSVRQYLENPEFLPQFEEVQEKIWAIYNDNPIRPTCKICGGHVTYRGNLTFSVYCSVTCARNCPEVQEKYVQTSMENYGCRNPNQSPIVRAKYVQTCMEKFNVPNGYQQPHIVAKAQASIQTPEVKKKIADSNRKTCQERYNVNNVTQIPEVRQKQIETCVKLYGSPGWCFGTNELHKQSIRENYGVDNVSQIPFAHAIPWLQDRELLFNLYVEQELELEDIRDEFNIPSIAPIVDALRNFEIPFRRKWTLQKGYSSSAIEWLEWIMRNEDIDIKHAENSGEYRIPGTKYLADGFCFDNNTVYEYYGDVFHGNINIFEPNKECHPFNNKTAQELYEETMSREEEIRQLGYTIKSIWEFDWGMIKKQLLLENKND